MRRLALIAALALAPACALAAEPAPAGKPDPNKIVTLTLGELQLIIAAQVAQSRAQDAAQSAGEAINKLNGQIVAAPPTGDKR